MMYFSLHHLDAKFTAYDQTSALFHHSYYIVYYTYLTTLAAYTNAYPTTFPEGCRKAMRHHSDL